MSQETPAAPAADAPKKSKKLLLVAAVVIIGVVAGGGAGAFMAGPMLAGGAAPATADSAGDEDGGAAAHGAAGKDGEAAAGAGVLVLVDNVVLNPARSGGARFLLVSIGLSVKDQAVADAMKARDAELRDAILRYLGAKEVDELTDVALRDSLKLGVQTALVERFGKGSVRDVYFPQFVIQ